MAIIPGPEATLSEPAPWVIEDVHSFFARSDA
jgi:hypothetical protein